MKYEFEMKDFWRTKFCLSLQLEDISNGILLHQTTYTEKVTKQFYMDKAHPLSTPMVVQSLDVIKEITHGKKSIKIIIFFPPGNFSFDLQNIANKSFKLENHEFKFKNSQLPDEVTLPDGYVIKRPEKWK